MTTDRDAADRWYDDHATELLDRLREVQAEVLRKMRRDAAVLDEASWARVTLAMECALAGRIWNERPRGPQEDDE